jgi:CHAD domain-containing protein
MAPTKPGQDGAALFRERVRRVFREFPGALAGEEEPVHQVRVAGRRLRVALPLLARKAKGRRLKRARRILNELTRAAGTGRDLDVLVGLMETRLGDLETPSAEQRQILRRLRAARSRSRARLADGILDLDIDCLRRDLRRIRDRGTADTDTILRRTQAVRERQGAILLRRLAAIGNRYDPEALHALRRRVRLLRYTSDVDDIVRGAESGTSDTWKALQDAIGALHDAHVLAGWLERQVRRAAGRGERNLAAAAEAERARFETEARRLHRKLLAARPGEMAARALGIDTPDENSRVKGGSAPSSSSSSSGTRAPFRSAPRTYPTPTAV